MEQTKAQLYGKNGEILERIFPGRYSDKEKDELEMQKEKQYQQLYRGEMQLIKGLDTFFERSFAANIPMGLGTAAIRFNVDFILDGLQIRHYFKGVVTAEDVTFSKPDPETFLKCAALLQVAPENCIVFEDSPKGIETAMNAGMKCIALTTMHTPEEFAHYGNIISIVDDYTNESLSHLYNNVNTGTD